MSKTFGQCGDSSLWTAALASAGWCPMDAADEQDEAICQMNTVGDDVEPVVLGRKRKSSGPVEDEEIWHAAKRACLMTNSWDDLPVELLYSVLKMVEPGPELNKLFSISKKWNAVLNEEMFWRESFEHWFGGTADTEDYREACNATAAEQLEIKQQHAAPAEAALELWFWGATNGHVSTMQRLMQEWPGVITVDMQNAESRSALYVACMRGHHNVAEMLLSHGAKVDITRFNGATPLHSACWNGHTDIVELLLRHGADVNATHNTGSTGLHSSSWKGFAGVVRLLLDARADVNASRHDGVKPLHEACWRGELEVVQALLQAGADINAVRNDGMTALCAACQQGHEAVVRQLLVRGADVLAGNRDGITPLHAACLGGNVSVVKLLIEDGADPTAQATVADDRRHVLHGRTPLMLAQSKENDEIVDYLEGVMRLPVARASGVRPATPPSDSLGGASPRPLLGIEWR